jgi:superfamily II DNA or RNA helicase/HKD family nuclease
MKSGIYDDIINKEIEISLKDVNQNEIIIDQPTESDIDLKILELTKAKLEMLEYDEKIEVLKSFDGYDTENIKKLNGISSSNYEIKYPTSGFDKNYLFTGSHYDPTLIEEFKKELKSTDKFIMLVSFIKKSGLAPLIDDLEKFTRRGGILNIITTTYMKASDYDAIVQLAKLKNTTIKINYDISRTRLHAKSYFFMRNTALNTAYIGSSNFSHPAMNKGLEWNVKLTSKTSNDVLIKFHNTFLNYWDNHNFKHFDPYNDSHLKLLKSELDKNDHKIGEYRLDYFDIRPYDYQENILIQLAKERKKGNYKNLVVAATGTGKTVIAAFDFKNHYENDKNINLLFVAHREEILIKSRDTFRIILNDNNFGNLYSENISVNNLFINVQSLKKLSKHDLAKYKFIIIDEAHHIAADSYQKLFTLNPKILLGLTATPFRSDEKNILSYFDNKASAEITLVDAINNKLVSPFNYYGVSDSVSYKNISMKGMKYNESELEVELMKSSRVNTIVNAISKYCIVDEVVCIGFCCTVNHARYMSESFNEMGLKSIYVTGNSSKYERSNAISRLENGEIQFIFTVDLYNEGVDIPNVNAVLFLRPTESPVVFAQQLGRGLRLHEDKDVLTVLDFIGNSNVKYDFRKKLNIIIQGGKVQEQIEKDSIKVPLGCEITLEEKAREYILDNLSRMSVTRKYFESLYFENQSIQDYFIENEIEIRQFYKYTSFTNFKSELDYKNVKGFFLQLIKSNDFELLTLIKDIYNGNILSEPQSFLSNRVFKMAFYTFFDSKVKYNPNILFDYVNKNNIIKEEVNYLIDFILEKNIFTSDINILDNVPLKVNNTYTSQQVMAAFGRFESAQSGIISINDYQIYLMFVTLQKDSNHQKNNFDYDDKIISENRMNWVSDTKKPGLREANIRSKKFKNLMFIRNDKKDEYGHTDSYVFIGEAIYTDIRERENKENIFVFEFENKIHNKFVQL